MSIRVRFRHDRRGIHQVLVSAEVQTMLHAKGTAVQQHVEARGIRVEGEPGDVPLPVTVNTSGKGIRARTYVELAHPSGLAVEQRHGVLVEAIDAARGVS
jgi:hypothetical protein